MTATTTTEQLAEVDAVATQLEVLLDFIYPVHAATDERQLLGEEYWNYQPSNVGLDS